VSRVHLNEARTDLLFVGDGLSVIVGSGTRRGDVAASVLLIWSKNTTYETLKYVVDS